MVMGRRDFTTGILFSRTAIDTPSVISRCNHTRADSYTPAMAAICRTRTGYGHGKGQHHGRAHPQIFPVEIPVEMAQICAVITQLSKIVVANNRRENQHRSLVRERILSTIEHSWTGLPPLNNPGRRICDSQTVSAVCTERDSHAVVRTHQLRWNTLGSFSLHSPHY